MMRWRPHTDLRSWCRRRPFIGAYDRGKQDAEDGVQNRGSEFYVNRGWGHQFLTAYDVGYRDGRREASDD